MERANKPAKPLRRSLVLRHLSDPADSGNGDLRTPGEVISSEHGVNLTAGEVNFEDIRGWLDDECAREEARGFDAERDFLDREKYAAAVIASRADGIGMDTTVLKRLRGNEPREVEDLLAPLRLNGSAPAIGTEESYDAMKDVLLAWNKHVHCSQPASNPAAREALLDALHARLKASAKVFEIVRDKRASQMYDTVGQEAILEPSSIQLRKALHLYRRETAEFKTKDPIEILFILWANTRPEVPDIKDDEELKYLTLKVLVMERELTQRHENEVTRRKIQTETRKRKSKWDKEGYERWKGWLRKHDKDIALDGVEHCIDAVLAAREELSKVVQTELLDLALLQAAQKSACADFHHTPSALLLCDTCTVADDTLDRSVRHHFPDLDATCEVAVTTVAEMRRIHDRVLTRALKFSGRDLSDENVVDQIVRERLREPATAMMMSDTLNDVKQAKRAAGQLLRQVDTMDAAMEELEKVVRERWREYDGLVGVLDGGGRVKDGV